MIILPKNIYRQTHHDKSINSHGVRRWIKTTFGYLRSTNPLSMPQMWFWPLRFCLQHHTIVSGILIFWLALVVGYIAILVLAGPSIDDLVIQWRAVLLVIQVTIGTLMFIAVITWFLKDETRGLKFGISGFLVSLITLQLHYFYISQLQQCGCNCCN